MGRTKAFLALTLVTVTIILIGCGGNAAPTASSTTGTPPATATPPPTSGSGGGTSGNAATTYTVQDIGNPGSATSMNDSGQVTGTGPHAWIWSNGQVTDLGALTANGTSWGMQINNSGQVGGFSQASDGNNHPILYSNGKMNDLGLPPGGTAAEGWGLNNAGQVVGGGDTPDGHVAFVVTGGKMQVLPPLTGSYSPTNGAEARGINDSGVVVGTATVGTSTSHAVMWTNGTIQDLGIATGNSLGLRINNSNQIVGNFAQGSMWHAFLWSSGTPTDLGTIAGRDSSNAWAINNAGVVVGSSFINAQPVKDSVAYIYQNGQLQDLNTLLPANSGWVLAIAVDINNRGQILAGGTHNGQAGLCILTPSK